MRWIRRRADATRSLVAIVLLSTVACHSSVEAPIPTAHPGDETPRHGGTLHLASFADIRGLDPAVTSDALGGAAIELLFAGLVDYDTKANLVPDLASRYEVSDDGLVYRFFLRESVLFHDGTEVTADDVRRSIERALHPTTPSPLASLYAAIAGYDAYVGKTAPHLDGLAVEGRYVIVIRLRERDARFLYALAMQSLRPVCKSAGDRYVDTWLPCGAGPFKVLPGGWDRGRSLTLVRHEGYFRPGRPYLDAVNWTYNVNRASQTYKFQDGVLDSTNELGDGDVHRFVNDPRWAPFHAFEPPRNVYGESMNTEMPPFDNVEVRRAVAAAIDREHYRLIKPSGIVPATQLIPPAVPGYDPSFRGQTYDYAAALDHMKKAGYRYDPLTGEGGYGPVIPYYDYPGGTGAYTAQVLQQDLAKIGLRIELRTVSFPTFSALHQRRRQAPMSAPGWLMDYPDPSDFFDFLFSSEAINDEDSSNSAFYKNPRLDEILVRARHELDTRVRMKLYGEANRIVCDEAPWAFTFFFRYFVIWQPYVHGFGIHAVWTAYAANAWLDRSEAHASRALSLLWPNGLASVAGSLRLH
jgi:ABC-type transport system substrate-binding protein